jgi:site-specific DNA recombinase
MANVYRQQVAQLAEALEHEESGAEAAEALRGLVESVILTPDGDQLRIELKGNLAAMLGAAQKTKRPPETGDLSLQIPLVAGARNHHYLQLWRLAA